MNIAKKLVEKTYQLFRLPARLESVQEALGRIESRLNRTYTSPNPRDYEFKVYSQWGEDGIIDYLVTHVPLVNKIFIEFGVEKYIEANTLFLLMNRNWSGLIIDGSQKNIAAIRQAQTFWRYHLMADCAFITRDNINSIISRNGIAGDVGLLSVDVDGNDYWIWEAIDVIQPRIIIAEYNSLFGAHAAVSTPYRADFYRTDAHASNMYYGASIAAMNHLAAKRGYSLVAGNSAGNNLFFVRNDVLGTLQPLSVDAVYVKAAFREARAQDGSVRLLNFEQRQKDIEHLPVVDVVSGSELLLKDVL